MRIGVCFKIVPDFEDTDPSEWENPEALDFRYVKKIYGCYDEAALETGLRLQDQLRDAGEDVSAVAVTVNPPQSATAESSLRALFAAGFAEVITIPGGADFDPSHTSAALADYFRENPADLILCGRMVGPGDSGMVPLRLAQAMGCNFYPETTALYRGDNGRIAVTTKEETHFLTRQITGPSLCAMGDAEAAYLRLFPLKARMAAARRSFTSWPGEAPQSAFTPQLLPPQTQQNSCRYLDPEQAPRILAELLKGVDAQ